MGGIKNKKKTLVFVQTVFHSAPPCSPSQQYRQLCRLNAKNCKRQLPFLTYLSLPAENLLIFCRKREFILACSAVYFCSKRGANNLPYATKAMNTSKTFQRSLINNNYIDIDEIPGFLLLLKNHIFARAAVNISSFTGENVGVVMVLNEHD